MNCIRTNLKLTALISLPKTAKVDPKTIQTSSLQSSPTNISFTFDLTIYFGHIKVRISRIMECFFGKLEPVMIIQDKYP